MIRIKPSGETEVWFHLTGDGPEASVYKVTVSMDIWLAFTEKVETEQMFRKQVLMNGVIEPMTSRDWGEIGMTVRSTTAS